MKLNPINEVGGSKKGSLSVSYKTIVNKIFPPNTTEIDDPNKVKASWGFQDNKGRKAFIWCYKYYGDIEKCKYWSIDGNENLLIELFGINVSF